MEDKILKILKQARHIEPRAEFQERSRRLIFLARRQRINIASAFINELRENFKFALALTLATFLLFTIIGGKLPLSKIFSGDATAFNGKELLREVENLNFQIQLGEAQYFSESAREIAAILGEIRNSDSEIDKLLNEIIF